MITAIVDMAAEELYFLRNGQLIQESHMKGISSHAKELFFAASFVSVFEGNFHTNVTLVPTPKEYLDAIEKGIAKEAS
jgi:hypothetical protein